MPKPYPKEFRREVISVARHSGSSVRQVASDFGISETCLKRWLKIADSEDDKNPATGSSATDEYAELRQCRKRVKELEQEVEVMRRAVVYLSQSMDPK